MLKFDLQRNPSLWAVCAAGLSALHVAGLIKHGPARASFKVPVAHGLWKHLFSGGSVCLQGLLLSLDILCVSRSPTVTSTCTCAGPTTLMCQGRSTPKTRLRVSSWVLVSLRYESHYEVFLVIRCHFNEWSSMLSRLRSTSCPQVTSAPSWWSTRRRCTSLQTVGRHGDRYVASSSSRRLLALDFLFPWQRSISVLIRARTLLRLEVAPLTVLSLLCQVFEEEHHILYLDHGGVIVAIKDTSIPLKILRWECCQEPLGNLYAAWMYSWALWMNQCGQQKHPFCGSWSSANFHCIHF